MFFTAAVRVAFLNVRTPEVNRRYSLHVVFICSKEFLYFLDHLLGSPHSASFSTAPYGLSLDSTGVYRNTMFEFVLFYIACV